MTINSVAAGVFGLSAMLGAGFAPAETAARPVIGLIGEAGDSNQQNDRHDPGPGASTGASDPEWQFGAFLDAGYLDSLHDPSGHLFRSRGTTPLVDEWKFNMGGAYVKKRSTESSRWGMELTGHDGEDSKLFGFSATALPMGSADWLLHFGPTNASYLAPVGSGLTLQGGIFSSFIGYDSLYAKDNFSYTRPWTADFTPYLMLGVSGSFAVSDRLTLAGFVVNGYWHLAHANDTPSFGGQLAFKPTERWTVKETVLYGPHEEDTSLELWRFLSNTIVERRTERLIAALDFHVSTEEVDEPGNPRGWWVAGQVPVRWAIHGPWSVTLRPEWAWDSDGRWTTFEQTVRAFTSTLEYRASLRQFQAIFRVEHRYDYSTGPGGGFFKDVEPGVVGLTPRQHLLIFGLIMTAEGRIGG